MSYLSTLILIALIIAVVYWLVSGIIAFLKTSKEDLNSMTQGPSASSLKQNKAMMMRVMFQAAAIIVIVLILASRH